MSTKVINGVTIELDKENNYCDVYTDDVQIYDGGCVENATHESIYEYVKDYINS